MPYEDRPNGEEVMPNPSLERRPRRRLSAEYKRRILEQADACGARGELAALLRREGLYASQLSDWRKLRESSGFGGLEAKPVGRKSKRDAKDCEIGRLKKERAKLEQELALARKIIDLQKKASALLDMANQDSENS